MNAFNSCDGTAIFIRLEMKCSIQRGKAELNRTFHLSPHENICTIALLHEVKNQRALAKSEISHC